MAQIQSVMLVDDDKFLLDMYAVKFKGAGITVDAVADPEEALKKLRAGATPDAILTDIVMPVLDGFGFLEAIQKEKLAPHAAIIMLSNQGQESDIARAKELGAKGYIVKASSIPSEVLEQTLAIVGKA